MRKRKINELADGVLRFLTALKDGDEIATLDALQAVYGCEHLGYGTYQIREKKVEWSELLRVEFAVRKRAKRYNLVLEKAKCKGPMRLSYKLEYKVKKAAR